MSDMAVAGLSGAALGAVCLGAAAPEAELDSPVACPFRLATGLPCPFCGFTRSLIALGQGRLDTSFEFAPLGPALPVVALVAGSAAAMALARGRPLRWPRWVLAVGAIVLAASWALQIARTTG